MKKKILIVSNHFYPYKGGLEKYALELATKLSTKYDVDVLAFQHDSRLPLLDTYENFSIYRLPCYEILGGVYSVPKLNNKYKKIISEIKEKNYDVVFTNTRFFTSTLLGNILAKKMKSKYIHIEHGNRFVQHKNPIVTLLSFLYDQTIGRFVISNANEVIVISKPGKQFVKRLGAKKTHYIPNSINTQKIAQVSTSLRKEYPKYKTIITYVGRLIYAKGIQDLILSMKDHGDIILLIIGDGPYRRDLEKLTQQVNYTIDFIGSLPQEKVYEYLSITDIFVNPSYSEGLPTSVLEAGAFGIATVATNVGGTKDIIKHGKNGFLIEPKNQKKLQQYIEKYINNPKLRKRHSLLLQKHIRTHFDLDVNIKKIMSLIKK